MVWKVPEQNRGQLHQFISVSSLFLLSFKPLPHLIPLQQGSEPTSVHLWSTMEKAHKWRKTTSDTAQNKDGIKIETKQLTGWINVNNKFWWTLKRLSTCRRSQEFFSFYLIWTRKFHLICAPLMLSFPCTLSIWWTTDSVPIICFSWCIFNIGLIFSWYQTRPEQATMPFMLC